MTGWLWGFFILAGGLFCVKMAYVFSTALALPATQGALYVSTARLRIAAALEAVPMAPGDLMVDLGCGDGRVLRLARRRYGVRGVGYELNPLAFLKARLLCMGRPDIDIRMRNFWSADLSGARVVFCYLFPDVMARMADKLAADLAPGATVVSCNFPLPGFRPEQVLRPGGSRHNDPIYIYTAAEIKGNSGATT